MNYIVTQADQVNEFLTFLRRNHNSNLVQLVGTNKCMQRCVKTHACHCSNACNNTKFSATHADALLRSDHAGTSAPLTCQNPSSSPLGLLPCCLQLNSTQLISSALARACSSCRFTKPSHGPSTHKPPNITGSSHIRKQPDNSTHRHTRGLLLHQTLPHTLHPKPCHHGRHVRQNTSHQLSL